MTNTEIIICTESGYLEAMSKLLVWSLRNFGGPYRNTPIFSYQPRWGFKISKITKRFFDQHNVEIIDDHLNWKFPSYPLANKPLAAAHREEHTNAKNLIFLDSDIFFLNEPLHFVRFDGHDVILRAVDHINIGAENLRDEKAKYWQRLYELLGVKEVRKVRTTGSNKEILEYYNTGHIVTQTKNGLFSRWKENFLNVMDQGLMPNNDLFYVEQSVFSATISQMQYSVKQLEEGYNHPIAFLKNSPDRYAQPDKIRQLVSIHYHKEFINNEEINPIQSILDRTENGRILNEKISDFGLIKKDSGLEYFIAQQKKRLKRLRWYIYKPYKKLKK